MSPCLVVLFLVLVVAQQTQSRPVPFTSSFQTVSIAGHTRSLQQAQTDAGSSHTKAGGVGGANRIIVAFNEGDLSVHTAGLLKHLQAGINAAGISANVEAAAAAAAGGQQQQQLFTATRLDGSAVATGLAEEGSAQAAAAAAGAQQDDQQPSAAGFQGVLLTAAGHLLEQLVLQLVQSYPQTRVAVRDLVVSAQVAPSVDSCVSPQALSAGVLVTKPAPAFKWPSCITAKTQLRWIGQRAGPDMSQVQYLAIVAVYKSNGAIVKVKNQVCVQLLDSSKPASWNAQRFGSPTSAPKFAAGALPMSVCMNEEKQSGSETSGKGCLTSAAGTGATGAAAAAGSVVQTMSLTTPVLCDGKYVQSLEYTGKPCGPDNKFVLWTSASTPDGCVLQRSQGTSITQFLYNANLFGCSCGQPPANAATAPPSLLCTSSTSPPPGGDPSIPDPSTSPPPGTQPSDDQDIKDDSLPGPRLARAPVAKGEIVPTGVERIRAARLGSVPSTAGLPLERQVVVAVADSGVDSTHPDINFVGGRSFVDASVSRADDDPAAGADYYGHGTHVAGIVGARNDGAGVVGVSPGVPIYSLKVLDGSGKGTLSRVLDAVTHALDNADSLRIKVINLSLSTFVSPDLTKDYQDYINLVCTLMERVSAKGIVVVAASGNYGQDVRGFFPAMCPTVVAVTATDAEGPASFSNYLPENALESDINTMMAAPGTWIYSTTSFTKDPNGYRALSGTSMASPHVAGVFANCFMSGACSQDMTGAQMIPVVRADALSKLASMPGYGFSGDLTPNSGKLYGPLVWAKY